MTDEEWEVWRTTVNTPPVTGLPADQQAAAERAALAAYLEATRG